ncbi:MAG TPA: hypothetical protein VHP12_09545 [Chitinophagaceae bacterium]|nr:hypothetical protein [Chitinophagaceae bacterium]
MRKFSITKKIGIGILFAIIATAGIALFGYIVMSLWNGILVSVLSVKAITFWQAMGILILSKILFGGFSKGCGHHRGHFGWNKKMKEKWEKMSPEEREEFKQQWRNKCRTWKGFDETAEKNAE